MKKWMLNISSVLVVAVYLMSTMGYGIHECICDGSKEMVLLYGATPCESVHPEHVCSSSNYLHSDHSACCSSESLHSGLDCVNKADCCSTVTYTLTHKQLNTRSVSVDPIEIIIVPFMMAVYNDVLYSTINLLYKVVEYPSGFKNILERSLQIVSASQIRI